MKITNVHGISLTLAVWLLSDDYDYNHEERYISATTLLKSTKQIILGKRVDYASTEMDVSDFIARKMGHAMHDSIEKAWRQHRIDGMVQMGYPDEIAKRLVINPRDQDYEANPDLIPMWIEHRATKEVEVNGKIWKVGGKFDIVLDERLFDHKSTSVWSYMKRSKDDDYGLQGGIYRWLNPDKIKDDHIFIQFIFTDWQRAMSKQNPEYPQIKVMEYPVLMPSNEDVDLYVHDKIKELSRLWDAPEDKLPQCTDKELWRNEPSYRYYSDPEKAKDPNARSSKNFDTAGEANAYAKEKGKGVVVTKLGEPKACEYCPAFDVCKQKDAYFATDN